MPRSSTKVRYMRYTKLRGMLWKRHWKLRSDASEGIILRCVAQRKRDESRRVEGSASATVRSGDECIVIVEVWFGIKYMQQQVEECSRKRKWCHAWQHLHVKVGLRNYGRGYVNCVSEFHRARVNEISYTHTEKKCVLWITHAFFSASFVLLSISCTAD